MPINYVHIMIKCVPDCTLMAMSSSIFHCVWNEMEWSRSEWARKKEGNKMKWLFHFNQQYRCIKYFTIILKRAIERARGQRESSIGIKFNEITIKNNFFDMWSLIKFWPMSLFSFCLTSPCSLIKLRVEKVRI